MPAVFCSGKPFSVYINLQTFVNQVWSGKVSIPVAPLGHKLFFGQTILDVLVFFLLFSNSNGWNRSTFTLGRAIMAFSNLDVTRKGQYRLCRFVYITGHFRLESHTWQRRCQLGIASRRKRYYLGSLSFTSAHRSSVGKDSYTLRTSIR